MLSLSFAKHVSADGGKHVILNRTFFLLLMRKNTTTHYLTIRNQERIHPTTPGEIQTRSHCHGRSPTRPVVNKCITISDSLEKEILWYL